MKAATVKELKIELEKQSPKELVDLCLRLSKFKKENKEYLTYLLYEAADEESFIRSVKVEIEEQLSQINTRSYYIINKSIRKILRNIKKHIRYSKKKETQVELLLFFCGELQKQSYFSRKNRTQQKLLEREQATIRKTVAGLHEDLQHDYNMELEAMIKN